MSIPLTPVKRMPLVALLAALGAGTCLWFAGAAGGQAPKAGAADQKASKKEFAREYFQSFKGVPENRESLQLRGPDAEECVKFEAEGLRITLPAGLEEERKFTGLSTGVGIECDFEITVRFEVLQEPRLEQAGKAGTKWHLLVTVDKPPWEEAGFSRVLTPKGGTRFTTWFNRWEKAGGKNRHPFKDFPAKTTKGRFRMARAGSVLSYFLSEGADTDFVLLKEFPSFGKDDVKDVRLIATTGGPKAALDVRFTDLRIRADSLDVPAPVNTPSASPPPGPHWKLWLALGILGLAGVLFLALRLYRRAKSPYQAHGSPTPVSFWCSSCGKQHKVKADLAGKKVKCVQCGQAVLVPGEAV